MVSSNATVPPMLNVVGSLKLGQQTYTFYVYYDNIRYKFSTFLPAIDVCMKTYFIFRIKYPVSSEMFWSFVAEYFFKLKESSNAKIAKIIEKLGIRLYIIYIYIHS